MVVDVVGLVEHNARVIVTRDLLRERARGAVRLVAERARLAVAVLQADLADARLHCAHAAATVPVVVEQRRGGRRVELREPRGRLRRGHEAGGVRRRTRARLLHVQSRRAAARLEPQQEAVGVSAPVAPAHRPRVARALAQVAAPPCRRPLATRRRRVGARASGQLLHCRRRLSGSRSVLGRESRALSGRRACALCGGPRAPRAAAAAAAAARWRSRGVHAKRVCARGLD